MNIHELLKSKRLEAGISQLKLATELDIEQARISKWEKSAVPSSKHLVRLCLILGITLTDVDKALKEHNNG